MESAMTHHLCCSVLGLGFGLALAGASTASADDLIGPGVPPSGTLPPPAVHVEATAPAGTVPVETVETVRTVRRDRAPIHQVTVSAPVHHPVAHVLRKRPADVVTTTTRRTVVREGVVPAPTVVAAGPTYAETWAPGTYDELYDAEVAPPPPPVPPPAVAQPFGPPVVAPAFRYVYEPGRILVIDANTGIAVQAIPR
jgi:hypothetical protein